MVTTVALVMTRANGVIASGGAGGARTPDPACKSCRASMSGPLTCGDG